MSTVNTRLALPVAVALVILALAGPSTRAQSLPPSCESEIYCQGDLLRDVQLAMIYNDSKTFVDKKLKFPESVIITNYAALRQNGVPKAEDLQKFVEDNFQDGNELEEYTPDDWVPCPSLASKVIDKDIKQWVVDLNNVTLSLSRKVKQDVFDNPEYYSFLPVPNGFVIPGGRFLELYYWDSYWIVNGLLLCDMVDTARGVIDNFLYLLKTYGIIPNGSRKYYLQRSQPPLLTRMVSLYYSFTKDLNFIRQIIPLLEQEYRYWLDNQTVKIRKGGVTYLMFRYYAPSRGPRPESYREDYNTASTFSTDQEKTAVYINLKSGAESGHDFSTRWFIKGGTNIGNLSDINTIYIVPVDLNSFLHYNLKTLSSFFMQLGDQNKAVYYKNQANQLLSGIENILWNPSEGIWFDFDLRNKKPRNYFYGTNFSPLWTGSYRFKKQFLTKSVLNYLAKYNIPQYVGVPTSLYNSGQQWDFPNAWAPLQAILIEGLRDLGTDEADCAARYYGRKWLYTNYKGWTTYRKMFEKYDVLLPGETGSGGEYSAQDGFGWTNGFVLALIDWLCDVTVCQLNLSTGPYQCPH